MAFPDVTDVKPERVINTIIAIAILIFILGILLMFYVPGKGISFREDAFGRIPVENILTTISMSTSTILAIIFAISQFTLSGISERYSPYIIEKYSAHPKMRRTFFLLISIIIGSLLLLFTWKFIKSRSAYVFFLILIFLFIYGLTRFATYFYFSLQVINPLKFMGIMRDDVIEYMKKQNEKEIENHVVSLGDACIKAVTRHEERVTVSFIQILYSMFEGYWELGSRDPYKYLSQECSSWGRHSTREPRNCIAKYIIDQYERIFTSCLENGEKEAAREVDLNLYGILIKFVSKPGDQFFVKNIVSLYLHMLGHAIDTEDDSKFHLYDYVFSLAQQGIHEREAIAEEYLNELFFQHLFLVNSLIIRKNDMNLFSQLINSYSSMVSLSPHERIKTLKDVPYFFDVVFSLDSEILEKTLEEEEYLKEIVSMNIVNSFFQTETFHSFKNKLKRLRDSLIEKTEELQIETQIQMKDQLSQQYEGILEILYETRISLLLHMAFFLTGAFILLVKKKNAEFDACEYFIRYWGCMEGIGIRTITANKPPLSLDIEFLTRLLFYRGSPTDELIWQFVEFESFQEVEPYLHRYYVLLATYAIARKSRDWKIEFNENENFEIMKSRYAFLDRFTENTIDKDDKKGNIICYIDELIAEADEWNDLIPDARNAFEETRKWFVGKGKETERIIKKIIAILPRDSKLESDMETGIIKNYEEMSFIEHLATLERLESKSLEDSVLNTIETSCRIFKKYFIKFPGVLYPGFDACWKEIGRKISYKEKKCVLKLILREINPIKVEGKDIMQINSSIEHQIHALKENGYEPNVIFVPLDLLTKLKKESSKKDSPLRGIIVRSGREEFYSSSGKNIKIIQISLEEIVILDKNVLSWKYRVDNETDQRITVSFEENAKDNTMINVDVKTVGKLEIIDQEGIRAIEFIRQTGNTNVPEGSNSRKQE